MRQAGSFAGTAHDLYNIAIQEARAALVDGQIDLAEQKALAAQRMNVVPALTSDRAESVLHDIAMIRERQQQPGEPGNRASSAAEREANDLLASGQRDAAATRFLESERLRAQEQGYAVANQLQDPAVQPAQAEVPAQSLTLTPIGNEPDVVGGPSLAPPVAPRPAPEAPALAAEMTGPDATPIGNDPLVNDGLAMPSPEVETTTLTDAGSVPALELNPTPTPDTPANQGEAMLAQATALMSQGNFAEARQLAEQARDGGLGVETQAEDLLAQIALSAQGGSLKLYEAALDALRRGDVDRCRALLSEIAAQENQDEVMMQKVQDLLARMPADAAGSGNASPPSTTPRRSRPRSSISRSGRRSRSRDDCWRRTPTRPSRSSTRRSRPSRPPGSTKRPPRR